MIDPPIRLVDPAEAADSARRARVSRKVAEAYDIVTEALDEYIVGPKKRLTGECVLFSGGNDSTVLAHLFRRDVDYFVHIDTGIRVLTEDGTERSAALEHVEACAEMWDVPLIVETGDSYRKLVKEQGFPGPAQHFKMYQRLKERGLRKVRRRLVEHSFRERVLFIAGRRRQESKRRKTVPAHERDGSIVWASPLVNWSAQDMADYRKVYPNIPRNPVSDELHMSGECLCGAFAKKGELDELGLWRPSTAVYIRSMEAEIADDESIPIERRKWGWGAYRNDRVKVRNTGPLCAQCVLSFTDDSVEPDPSRVGPLGA